MAHLYAFDLFGTLLDYGSLRDEVSGLTPEPDLLIERWRGKQIALSQAATLMGRYIDFDAITHAALSYSAAVCAVEITAADRERLCNAWERLPAFPDVPAALDRLQRNGNELAILTNATPSMLQRCVASAGIATKFGALISVQAANAYKPAPQVYQLLVDRFDVPVSEIRFVSSNGWDAAGASEFGFEVFWCNRAGLPLEPLWKPPAHTIASLAGLP